MDNFRSGSAFAACGIYLILPTMYLATEAYAAMHYKPFYSYKDNFTSQLGVKYVHQDQVTNIESHSQQAWIMNLNFLLNGPLFFYGQFFLLRANPDPKRRGARIIIAALYGVGMILLAAFPTGPRNDYTANLLHYIGACLALMLGNINSFICGDAARKSYYKIISMALGVGGLCSLFYFFLKTDRGNLSNMGAWQRAAIYPTLAWEFLTADYLMGQISSNIKENDKNFNPEIKED